MFWQRYGLPNIPGLLDQPSESVFTSVNDVINRADLEVLRHRYFNRELEVDPLKSALGKVAAKSSPELAFRSLLAVYRHNVIGVSDNLGNLVDDLIQYFSYGEFMRLP